MSSKSTRECLEQIAEGVGDLAEKGARQAGILLEKGKRKAYQVASELEREVREGDGVGGAARKVATSVARGAATVATTLYQSLAAGYKKFEETFFTKGEFDEKKAKRALQDAAKATKQFGEETVKTLKELVQEGAQAVQQDYRTYVPTAEERRTRYAGIGTQYAGVPLRPRLEACLAFHEEARKRLPGGLKVRESMLKDIKASASANFGELVAFYVTRSNQKLATPKIEAAMNYLNPK
ncbi:hypothetical protein HYS48_03800 [Candidatus Woesearchaeota archaeon]|nr:hypothetical protein [Candidatus Woesearchaeota archaeon]